MMSCPIILARTVSDLDHQEIWELGLDLTETEKISVQVCRFSQIPGPKSGQAFPFRAFDIAENEFNKIQNIDDEFKVISWYW